MKDKEKSPLQLSILTFNVLSENYIKKSSYQNYNYQDRYLYIVNWLNSLIISKKTSPPDIILLQEFDQELWSEFKNKSTTKSSSMFDDYLFIYTYFDKGKVGVFKESISKILESVGIHEFTNLNFFSDVVHPGMVMAINIKKFMILPSCQPEFNPGEHLNINKLFTIDYLRKENSYNLSELVYTIWPFQNMNLFIQNLFSESNNKDRKSFFRFNPLRFCQSVCLILKSENIPIIVSNVSLEKNEQEMAIAQLNYLHEFNHHIKRKFIVEPNHILVGNIRFSASDMLESSKLPANIKINYKFTDSEISIKKHHDYIITSSDMITPKFINEYPDFKDKRTIYPNFEKKFIIILSDKEKKSGVLNQKENWPSDHEALLFKVSLFDSNKKEIESSIRLSDINKKTNHLFDSLFKEKHSLDITGENMTGFHDFDPSLNTYLSDSQVLERMNRNRLNTDSGKQDMSIREKMAHKMIKRAFSNKDNVDNSLDQNSYEMPLQKRYHQSLNNSEEYVPYELPELHSSIRHTPSSMNLSRERPSMTEFQVPNEDKGTYFNRNTPHEGESYDNYTNRPYNDEDSYYDTHIPFQRGTYNESTPLPRNELTPNQDLDGLSETIPEPYKRQMTNIDENQYQNKRRDYSLDEDLNYGREYSETNQAKDLGNDLSTEFEELPEINQITKEDFLNDVDGADRYEDTYRQRNMSQSGGNIDSDNNTDINKALQILIDNIEKVEQLKKDIHRIDRDVSSPKRVLKKKKGGVNKKRKSARGRKKRVKQTKKKN